MEYKDESFIKLVRLIETHAPLEGVNFTSINNFGTYKVSEPQKRTPAIDHQSIFIIGQGVKYCHAGDKRYDHCPGNVVAMFLPMAVETEIVHASPEVPFLAAGVAIDLGRMADVLLRIDRIDGVAAKPATKHPSGIISIPLNDHLLEVFIRLFEVLEDPRDAAMLGESIVDEIYYRLLCSERGDDLRFFLQQRGEIQRISKSVEYIHQNYDKPVSVAELADMVHMSRTAFYENFREVMHISPLQYAKSVKLDKAQTLIREGKKANEAGYLVGYNSPAQFSREYKRHFGFAPSLT